MSQWRLLLNRITAGLNRLRESGQPTPDWALGGGTAIMLHTGHRLSKDIDAFIVDPQYLSILSPRLSENIWACDAFSESANHLKLVYPEGEIDFIVGSTISNLPAEHKSIALRNDKTVLISVEHPVEIVLKKLRHRASLLKVRDVFDIAVVDSRYQSLLRDNLHRVSDLKGTALARLSSISEEFCREELAELDIADEWRSVADGSLARVKRIAEMIP